MAEEPLQREVIEQLARDQPQALVEIVLRQSAAIAALEQRVAQLEEVLREGGGPPGAAPFRLDPRKRKALRKAPGREFGHRGEFRRAPETIDEIIEVPLKQCPCCGGAIGKTTPVEQTIVELPAVRPLVVRLITYRGRCERCAQMVQSAHPLQVSRACGAAGTQLGPRALASAALLRHGVGLTVRSCCAVLEKLFALRVSAGGLCQALDRLARRMEGSYQELSKQLQQSAVVHTDPDQLVAAK